MSEEPLPYGRQWIDEADIAAVVEVLRSARLTTGPVVEDFERSLAAKCDVEHAVAVNSGTAALHCMYFAAGLGPGDEIITSPLTFAATANVALHLGATVRFVDVSPDTGNIDPAAVEAAIGDRTRLIVAVDFAGHPAPYDELTALADRHGIKLLADAAHSLGGRYGERPVGSLAHASAFSFHPVKAITCGEGGAIVTNDPQVAELAARFRTHGIARGISPSHREIDPWLYEQHHLGLNYRLSDVHAALGNSQLRRLEEFIDRRSAIAHRYLEAFAGLDGLTLPQVRDGVQPGWHLFVVRVYDPKLRRSFFNRLKSLGLGVQVHYIPVPHHPYYRRRGMGAVLPAAEDYSARSVSIPLFPKLSERDIDRVIAIVRRAAAELLS